MRTSLLLLYILTTLLVGCTGTKSTSHKTSPPELFAPSEEIAVSIAMDAALKDRLEVEKYKVSVSDEINQWRVNFDLKDIHMKGGGVEYIINKQTGKIVDKSFFQ